MTAGPGNMTQVSALGLWKSKSCHGIVLKSNFISFSLLAEPQGIWDLSSLTRVELIPLALEAWNFNH